jgi:hypothetical protein
VCGLYPLTINLENGKLFAAIGAKKTEIQLAEDNSFILLDKKNPHLPIKNRLNIVAG